LTSDEQTLENTDLVLLIYLWYYISGVLSVPIISRRPIDGADPPGCVAAIQWLWVPRRPRAPPGASTRPRLRAG
jgi:hypothetical protein